MSGRTLPLNGSPLSLLPMLLTQNLPWMVSNAAVNSVVPTGQVSHANPSNLSMYQYPQRRRGRLCSPLSRSLVWTLYSELTDDFSLCLEDDDAYLNASSSQNLGEISLKFWKVTLKSACLPLGHQIPEELKVHERSKKGVPHRVKYVLSPWGRASLPFTDSLDLEKKYPECPVRNGRLRS
jgi:hypothetical protein